MSEASVWIDNTELQSLGVTVKLDSSEPMLPEFRTNTVTVPGRHGAYDFGAYMDVRQFALNCVLPRKSYTDQKAQIRQFVRLFVDDYGRPKTVKLRFGDEPDKYYDVKVSGGVPVERLANLGFFTLPLVAHDPLAKFIVPSNDIIMDSNVPILSDVIWETGLGSRRVTGPTSFKVINNGTVSIPFSFRLEGRGELISVSINGRTLSVKNLSNEVVEIDGDTFVIKFNGNTDMTRMTGSFLELSPGENTVSVNGYRLDVRIGERLVYKYL
ncbi:phage tail domain-containing protein [Cytobacillus purgationiresistens]|uniref:Phage-related protein n=1 Tax=Cytobacillus purgationiresistens TaxID=863449 RepID=A0ABU0AHI1_9BACI|nr:phage tail domain-containing protein [Cytobacillus purgationiresistens]MDQ0270718.1 phage-related protein [Cytobacillus purgationiresistens]